MSHGRIKNLAASANIESINTVDPWVQLFSDLGDEESTLSITPPTKPTPAKRARSASAKSPTPVSSTSSQSASVASSEEAPPPPKMLTTRQVNAVGLLYKSIPPNERWKLTSEKIVEDEMEKKLAAKSKYEHPVHSLVLDPEDVVWSSIFTSQDLKEIREYKQAPTKNLSTVTLESQDISDVEAKLGESVSAAVATGRNIYREISTSVKRRRKTQGAKLDILYRSGMDEVGCCEVGKLDVTTVDSKYLDDGLLKMPKTLRDMLVALCRQKLGVAMDLTTVGYLLMGTKMQLVQMDFPHNLYISRVSRSPHYEFPMNVKSVSTSLPALLELTWKGRTIMETTLDKLYEGTTTVSLIVEAIPY
ncbi:hypothetical protein MBANPS3_010684 [Mucor bainieri]